MKMSQQKFASNVVEKCLTFGGPAERQLLVNEMLGSSDENAPLQVLTISQPLKCSSSLYYEGTDHSILSWAELRIVDWV